mmetsp:Transcript_15512/g.33081  ORF Transcript_15512/g.33081 Transcript_15512/m.33081 type:complete len:323 (-) Transcript_15512:687-1655(-)
MGAQASLAPSKIDDFVQDFEVLVLLLVQDQLADEGRVGFAVLFVALVGTGLVAFFATVAAENLMLAVGFVDTGDHPVRGAIHGNRFAELRVLSERIDNFVRKERAVADEGRKRHRRVWVGQSNLDEILVLRPDHLAEKLAVEKKLLQNGVQVDGRFFAYSDEETREMVGQLDACHASKGVEEQVRRHLVTRGLDEELRVLPLLHGDVIDDGCCCLVLVPLLFGASRRRGGGAATGRRGGGIGTARTAAATPAGQGGGGRAAGGCRADGGGRAGRRGGGRRALPLVLAVVLGVAVQIVPLGVVDDARARRLRCRRCGGSCWAC